VVSVASHDTASAVAAVPFDDTMSEAFISSGTWSLVGIEANQPIKSEEAFSLNLTNELGVYGTVRILKNVTGMWLLEECRRQWLSEGENSTVSKLLIDAENCDIKSVIDPNDPVFMAPGRMPERIAQYCIANKMQEPKTIGEFTFVILNSLAHSYKKTLDEISSVTGRKISTIHVIGGGSQIELLNRLTADVCQVVVKTGPVEATLFGNIAVQAITAGIYPDIQTARKIIERSVSRNIVIPNN
jgi:rhamnulokinase